jgi:hypothetical protein
MSITNSVVAVYDTHAQAEHAIKELQEAGVDMKSLSIAGKTRTRTSTLSATTTPGTV